jgi:hypothetical protein
MFFFSMLLEKWNAVLVWKIRVRGSATQNVWDAVSVYAAVARAAGCHAQHVVGITHYVMMHPPMATCCAGGLQLTLP